MCILGDIHAGSGVPPVLCHPSCSMYFALFFLFMYASVDRHAHPLPRRSGLDEFNLVQTRELIL